jgi:hypothetical protein
MKTVLLTLAGTAIVLALLYLANAESGTEFTSPPTVSAPTAGDEEVLRNLR